MKLLLGETESSSIDEDQTSALRVECEEEHPFSFPPLHDHEKLFIEARERMSGRILFAAFLNQKLVIVNKVCWFNVHEFYFDEKKVLHEKPKPLGFLTRERVENFLAANFDLRQN